VRSSPEEGKIVPFRGVKERDQQAPAWRECGVNCPERGNRLFRGGWKEETRKRIVFLRHAQAKKPGHIRMGERKHVAGRETADDRAGGPQCVIELAIKGKKHSERRGGGISLKSEKKTTGCVKREDALRPEDWLGSAS